MKRRINRNSTSHVIPFSALDTNTSDRSGLTGLVYNTSGLSCNVCREGENSAAMTLELYFSFPAFQAPTADMRHIRFAPDGTIPGRYLLCLPNEIFSDSALFGGVGTTNTGCRWVTIDLYGAANMAPVAMEIEIVDPPNVGNVGDARMANLDGAVSTAIAAAASAAASAAAIQTILTGITRLANWLRAITRKGNNDATAVSEINANNGSGTGTFDPTTDSEEAIRDRGDSGAWGGGGLGGPLVIALTCTAGSKPVPGATVIVRNSTDTATLAIFTADSNGLVNIDAVANTAYKLRITAPGQANWVNPIARTWSASGSDTIDGTQFSTSPPASADYCVLAIYPEEATVSSTDFTATLSTKPDAYDGRLLDATAKPFVVVTGDHFEVQLVRTGHYRIQSSQFGVDQVIQIPDAPSADLRALLNIT